MKTQTALLAAGEPAGFIVNRVRVAPAPPADAAILVEQLRYLIDFADQEQDRLARVKAVLMETFR
jgi:hypothetical protein